MTNSLMADQSKCHPLNDRDEADCYDVMMKERSDLINAKRESEDALVKSIIQLSAALIVVLVGFFGELRASGGYIILIIYIGALTFFTLSVLSGLTEHYLSSIAYGQQIEIVEKFYTRQSSNFSQPSISKWVRLTQVSSFTSFGLGLITLAAMGAVIAMESSHDTANSTKSATANSSRTDPAPR